MTSATADAKQAETERQIRERLEETGEFGKMRAMIVDAALHSLVRDQPTEAKEKVFLPSKALVAAKEREADSKALGAVYAYLQQLGLQYTASVMALETGVSAEVLQRNGASVAAATAGASDGVLAAVLGHAGGVGSNGNTLVPVPVPAPVVGVQRTPPPPPSSSSSSSSSSKHQASEPESDGGSESEKSDVGAEAEEEEEPPQPGAEDSTYYISKWKKKKFLRVNQVTGQQVQVEYLTDCSIVVLDPLDSMTVDDCEGGELVIAACEGSVFLRNCKNMVVHVACKQLRTRDCENVDLHIFTTTDPVVEMSHHMTFRPFHLRLPNLRKSFKDTRLDPATNRFVHVYDFTVEEPGLPKPHFTVKYPDHGVVMEDRCADQGVPECPSEIEKLLTGALLPAASSESGQNKSYDIKTGSAAWAAAAAAAAVVQPTAHEETHESAEEDVDDGDEEAHSKATDEDEEEEGDDAESVPSDDGKLEGSAGAATAIPVPTMGSRPPVAPSAVPASTGAAKLGGLDDQEYSSFDESSESANGDDKYEVEEDDDDF